MSKRKSQAPVYQIKVTLLDSKPPIWRRLLLSGDTKLSELHDIIQAAMGWYDSHLHQFIINNVYYSVPFDDMLGGWEMETEDERRVKLSDIVDGEGFRFDYEYDFGDSWQHRILVEKILPPDDKQRLPVCIKGKRACPPEDVGGVWGYDSFLEAMQDPNHPEHEMYVEWIGDSFDAEAFDLDEVNQRLRRFR